MPWHMTATAYKQPVVDPVSHDDNEFFRRNLGRQTRMRLADPSELTGLRPPDSVPGWDNEPTTDQCRVIVVRMGDGGTLRIPYYHYVSDDPADQWPEGRWEIMDTDAGCLWLLACSQNIEPGCARLDLQQVDRRSLYSALKEMRDA